MSIPIASYEAVKDAASKILARNPKGLTADAVLAELGGGSKGTVLKHLRQVREELGLSNTTASAMISAPMRARLDTVLAGLCTEIRDETRREDEARSALLANFMVAMEQDLEQAQEETVRLTGELEKADIARLQSDEQNREFVATIESLKATVSTYKAKLERQTRDLEQANETIASLKSRVDANQVVAERMLRIEKALKINA